MTMEPWRKELIANLKKLLLEMCGACSQGGDFKMAVTQEHINIVNNAMLNLAIDCIIDENRK